MKRSFLDKMIGVFSPEAEVKRINARGKLELMLRTYDAAKTFNTDDWSSATKGSANSEIRGAQETLRSKGRDAIRNNSYAGRGLAAIVSNTVGPGILPNIKGKTKLQTKRLNDAWKEWGETTLCDATGKHNFYSMQALALRSTVESGEVLALKEIGSKGHQLRLLESDHIVTYKDRGSIKLKKDPMTIQGVKLDSSGRVESYFIYESHPGELVSNLGEREVPAELVCHLYRQDRPGQLRGVSWFHPVIRQLEDLKEYQSATLVSKKIEACFSVFITKNNPDSTQSSANLITKRETESFVSPGSVKYLDDGEDMKFSQPSAVTGYDEYCRQNLRSIASGLGITYEALTSDYSQVNFSSGRMGHLEFRRNVEMWRWNMLIPLFCEPAFKHFLQWCVLVKNIPIDGATCEWVPPAWSMIDPTKEIAAFTDSIRAGLTSYPKAVREQGYDPIELMQEIADSNAQLDALNITLDSDPRKITKAGLLQVAPGQNNSTGDSNVTQTDKKVPSDGTPQNAD